MLLPSTSKPQMRTQHDTKWREYGRFWKHARSAPSMPSSTSRRCGRQRKNSLLGNDECMNSPMCASGTFFRSMCGTSSRW